MAFGKQNTMNAATTARMGAITAKANHSSQKPINPTHPGLNGLTRSTKLKKSAKNGLRPKPLILAVPSLHVW